MSSTPPSEPEPKERERSPWRQLGFVLGMAFTFPVAVLVGYGIGWWLDGKLGTSPVFSLVFLGLGFVAALLELMRMLKRLDRS